MARYLRRVTRPLRGFPPAVRRARPERLPKANETPSGKPGYAAMLRAMRPQLLLAAVLALLGLPPSPAAEWRFSHQFHLNKAGAVCIDCHASAETSNAAGDRNLPAEKACLACHDRSEAGDIGLQELVSQQTDKRSYRFNHEFHLKLGNIAPLLAAAIDSGSYLGKPGDTRRHLDAANSCQACHRGLEETDLAGKANLPRMSDCLICHSKVENPFSCETCHLEGVNLRPADHTREFADLHPTGKLNLDKATCLPCHGRNFACMGCH